MTDIKANLTPRAWAVWEVLFARYAAPGMCNPADEHPCTSGTPTQAQIDGDTRTLDQRRHDAFEFLGRSALDKGELGQLNGLPTSIIVRTTLHELRTLAGIGVTGGGTLIPIADVLTMAARANATNYLAVFDDATGSALDLFRTRRTASVGPTPRPDRPRRRLHQTRLHRARLRRPSPPRPPRLDRRRPHQRRRPRPGLRTATTAPCPRRLEHPPQRPPPSRMDSPHRTWTPAKNAPTTTTTPKNSAYHPHTPGHPPKTPTTAHTPDTADTADWWPVDHHRPHRRHRGLGRSRRAAPQPDRLRGADNSHRSGRHPRHTGKRPRRRDGDNDNDARDNGSDTHKPGGPEPPTSTAA